MAEPEELAETAGGSCEQPFGPALAASGLAACRLHLVQCQAACHCEPAGLVHLAGGHGEVPADQELVAQQPVPYPGPAVAALCWVHAVGAGAQNPLLGQPGVACRAAWLGPAPACKAHAAHADLHAVPAVLAKPAGHGLSREAPHQGLLSKPLKGLAERRPLCPGTLVRDPRDPWAAAVHLHWD